MSSRSRNTNRRVFRNRNRKCLDIFKRKKRIGLLQWTTPFNRRISPSNKAAIFEISHIWKTGDRYYKLAEQYYGNPEYWWVIARYNQKPTESHLRKGDIIVIPTPLAKLLEIL